MASNRVKTGLFWLHMLLLELTGRILADVAKPEYRYYTYPERTEFMTEVSKEYPNITHLYSIGSSVGGREMWAIAIGKNPRKHVSLRPDVKYVGNMHGNEIANQVLLLHLIHHLVTQYKTNSTINSFLQTTRVHILPTMNPDGAEYAATVPGLGNIKTWYGTVDSRLMNSICHGTHGRFNKNGVDLNRNFPDKYVGSATGPRQSETQAMMKWMQEYQFVLSANMHGGAVLANYPLDSYPNARENRYSASQDDDIFIHLAKVYSYTHRNMYRGEGCQKHRQRIYRFVHGITNGARWYPIHGGLQDYNYLYAGCFELTLELHCCKFSPVSVLEERWNENKDALINFLMSVHIGVKGTVRAVNGLELKDASVRVVGREMFETKTTPFGEFWRLLLPGTYTLEVYKTGFALWSKVIIIPSGAPLIINITLEETSDDNWRIKNTRSSEGGDSGIICQVANDTDRTDRVPTIGNSETNFMHNERDTLTRETNFVHNETNRETVTSETNFVHNETKRDTANRDPNSALPVASDSVPIVNVHVNKFCLSVFCFLSLLLSTSLSIFQY